MELTPNFTIPSIKTRPRVGFSQYDIVQDPTKPAIVTRRKCNAKKRLGMSRLEKNIRRPKIIRTFPDESDEIEDTTVVSAYSLFKSQNHGLFQSHNNNNNNNNKNNHLSWGPSKEDTDSIIDSIDRSFRNVAFGNNLLGYQSLLLLLCSSDTDTAMTISSRLLLGSDNDTLFNVKCIIYDGILAKESNLQQSVDPVSWLANEKKKFCIAIIARALQNIEKSMTEIDRRSMTKFIEADGPYLTATLSTHLTLLNENEQYSQISESLMFLISQCQN